MTTSKDAYSVIIPAVNYDKLLCRLTKLNNKAKKLNQTTSEVTIINKFYKTNEYFIDVEYYELAINTSEVKINCNYEFIGVIDHSHEKGNIIKSYSDVDLSNYRHNSNYCDHCNTSRQRKKVIILQNVDSKKLIQLGSSCVVDFFGYDLYISDLMDILESDYSVSEEDFFSMKFPSSINKKTFLIFISAMCEKDGYITKKQAEMIEKNSTVEKFTNLLFTEKLDEILVSEKHEIEADCIIKYIESIDTTNDFIHNVKTLISSVSIEFKNLAIAGYAYVLYKKSLEVKIDKSNSVNNDLSEYSEKMKVKNLSLKVIDYTFLYSAYGTTHLVKFVDSCNRLYSWFSSNVVNTTVGDNILLNGTVKGFSEYNGKKSVVLTRCKIIE